MRMRRLPFIPTSVNFSTLAPGQEEDLYQEGGEDFQNDIDKEILLLKTLSTLTSDKERCVLMLEILREYGYQIDYNSIAKSLKIELRWLMRIKANVKRKVKNITTNN